MIRKSLLSVVVLCLFSVVGFAQDKFVVPDQKITGVDDTVPAGEVIILKASPIVQKPQYLTDVSYQWKILEEGKEKKNVIVWPDGSTVVFGAGVLGQNQKSKKMTALLSVNYLYTVREGNTPTGKIQEVAQRNSGILVQDIYIGGTPTPPNPPGPGPGPDPTPVFPDGRFKLAARAYQLAMTTVDQPGRAEGAAAIATATEGISSAISSGVLNEIGDILKKLHDKNNSQLELAKIPVSNWDAFGKALQTDLYKLYKDKKLNVASDFADAFKEIVEGLRKVK